MMRLNANFLSNSKSLFKDKMNIITIILLMMLLFLQMRLWLNEGSIKEVLALKKSILQQETTVVALHERNQRLAAEVKDLKHQLGALEELARTDLGMVKQNETFYQFTENTSNKTQDKHVSPVIDHKTKDKHVVPVNR